MEINSKTASFRYMEYEKTLTSQVESKAGTEFTSMRELYIFLCKQYLQERDIEVQIQEKIVEIPMQIPNNSVLLEFSEKEKTILDDIVEMCQISNFAQNHKDLFVKLIEICNKRGELVLTDEDYQILNERRNGKQ
jgi:hypothetical protein